MRIAGTSLRPLEVWRSDVSLDQARDFGTSLLASAVRLGAGGVAHDLGPRPKEMLVLYESERCPFSRLVREALTELDLDALIKPCPKGEIDHHQELAQYGETTFPYLIDRSAGVKLGESSEILLHLFERYSSTKRVPFWFRGAVARESSRTASRLRGAPLRYERPANRPEQPLELWNYEASPYCRIVREQLGRLGLPYVSRNLARQSPRRAEFQARFERLQFPRLHDPNTSLGLFESDAIVNYIQSRYAKTVVPIGDEIAVHPA